MIKNIFKFENAYFGKPYKTRDGRKALYVKVHECGLHCLIVDGYGDTMFYLSDGTVWNIKEERNLDIVSEWTIDEEELDRLAQSYAKKELGYTDSDMSDFNSWSSVAQAKFREVSEDFKAGYRKAVESK